MTTSSPSSSMKSRESWVSSLFLYSFFPHWRAVVLILRALLVEPLPAPTKPASSPSSSSSSSSTSKAAPSFGDVSFAVCFRVRVRMFLRLLTNVLLAPFWMLCWIIDELMYGRLVDAQPIQTAIYCAGCPRSGTTFLFSVLNENKEQFVSVTHRQWRFPFVFLHLHIIPGLRRLCEACGWKWGSYWQASGAGAIASTLHPDEMDEAEEDDIVYEEVCGWHPFVALWYPFDSVYKALCRFERPDKQPRPQQQDEKENDDDDAAPVYGDGLPESVQNQMMRVRNRVVRKAAFLWACNRRAQGKVDDMAPIFVCKCSKSNSKLTALLSQPEWENAVLLTIWRQPQKSLASLARLVYMSSLAKTGWQSDPLLPTSVVGNYLVDQVTEGHCLVSALSTLPSSRVINVEYDLFSRHTKATVQAVFQRMGIKMTSSYRKYLDKLQMSQDARPTKYANEKNKEDEKHGVQNGKATTPPTVSAVTPLISASALDNMNDKDSLAPTPLAAPASSASSGVPSPLQVSFCGSASTGDITICSPRRTSMPPVSPSALPPLPSSSTLSQRRLPNNRPRGSLQISTAKAQLAHKENMMAVGGGGSPAPELSRRDSVTSPISSTSWLSMSPRFSFLSPSPRQDSPTIMSPMARNIGVRGILARAVSTSSVLNGEAAPFSPTATSPSLTAVSSPKISTTPDAIRGLSSTSSDELGELLPLNLDATDDTASSSSSSLSKLSLSASALSSTPTSSATSSLSTEAEKSQSKQQHATDTSHSVANGKHASNSTPTAARAAIKAAAASVAAATAAAASVTDFFDEAYGHRIVSQYFDDTEWTAYNTMREKVKHMHRSMLQELQSVSK